MIPIAPPSPHHHHTTPLRLHHHQSPHHHHHHHTTTKMLLPLIIHITQLENPNLFQQAHSHWWTQRNSWTQTPPINHNHNRKKKKKRKRKTQFNPDQNPYTTAASFLHRWSTQINYQNPTGTKTETSPINPDHNRKKKEKKKNQINAQTSPPLDQCFLHCRST